MHANVDHLMQGGLGQWLEQQTAMRAAAKQQAESRWTWGTAILLPVLALVWFGPELVGSFRTLGTIGGILAVGWWGYQPIAEAKRTIKVGINSAIAQSHGIQYSHDVEPGAEMEAAKRYGLVPSHDRSDFEDRWFGALEGHAFNLYEANLEERRGAGKNQRWVTVFRGVIIQMAFGRPFRSTTLLQRAGEHRKWFGLGGAKDSVRFDGHQLDFVDQVHPAFAEVFGLFSDDQVEARVLVHPSYVEHLLRLESAFGAKELRALFTQGQVIIAVEGGNLFESGTMDASEDRIRVEEAAEQFAALAGLALAINQTTRGRVLAEARPPAEPRPQTRALHGEAVDPPIVVPRPAGGFGRKGL
ncbi:MAG: hypothetical protein RIT17_1109 [Pseudomonadota bacterium]|jgi:Protein of unknown function (DUF3137)